MRDISTYLELNPLEMLHDPEDDDSEEEFELERYVYIVTRKKECPKRLLT